MASLCFVIVYLFATCAIYVLDDDGKRISRSDLFTYVMEINQNSTFPCSVEVKSEPPPIKRSLKMFFSKIEFQINLLINNRIRYMCTLGKNTNRCNRFQLHAVVYQ